MSEEMNRKKRRWGRWILLTLLFGFLALVGYVLFWPQVKIKVGPDTTVLTGPLNPDGTVNYVAALDESYGRGVTAENNAAVLILRAFGPAAVDEEVRDRVLQRLGMADLPAEGDYFIEWEDFEESLPPASGPEADIRTRWRILREATERVWTEQEFPRLAQWLKRNEKPVALIAAASRRPRYYMPLLSPSEPPWMIDVLLPGLGPCMKLARFLAARAMLRAGRGDSQGAWQDVMTVYRLARLLGQQPVFVSGMVTVVLDVTASQVTAKLAASGRLSPQQMRAVLADIQMLSTPTDLCELIDRSQRYCMLDTAARLSAGRVDFDSIRSISGGEVAPSYFNAVRLLHVDWNELLRGCNQWYDRAVEASRKPNHATRKAALEKWLAEFRAQVREPSPASLTTLKGGPTGFVSRLLLENMMLKVDQVRYMQDKLDVQRQLAQVALALAIYKAERGAYPEKLAALAPDCMKAVPLDLFVEKPLSYRRVGDGYRLYSVGPDMADDGGRTAGDDRSCDDLVVTAGSAATQPEDGNEEEGPRPPAPGLPSGRP